MRIYVCILLFCFSLSGQKRFQTDYFIQKHTLQLPTVTTEMLDVGELTHVSDTWEYFYKKNSTKLDSVVEYLTIEGFQASRTIEKYFYNKDTVVVRSVSIEITKRDTLNNGIKTFTNNFRTKSVLDLVDNCIWRSEFDERGIKLLDARKCSGENEFSGLEFKLTRQTNYIETITINRGVPDSNNIRRYFLTPFDSIVADYLVEKQAEPVFFSLNVFNTNNKLLYKYDFDVYRKTNPIIAFNFHTYDKSGRLKRIYFFQAREWKNPENGFSLSNYTEYEYDNLGRKIKTTTRVKPDPKPQKK